MSDIFNVGADPLSYSGIAQTPPAILSTRDPNSTDINYVPGQQWANTSSGTNWFLGKVLAGVATWNLAGAGSSGAVISFTGDAGGAEVPDGGGNFNLLGTANQITTTGSLNTETISVPATFIAPGSIASTTSMSAGTTLTSVGATTLATAGASVNTFGNATGATSLTFTSGSGGITLTATNAALTANSGTGILGISADAAATTVNVATGAGAKTATFGSTNTTSTTSIKSGSGGISLATTTNGPVTVTSGTGTVGISTDATATTVNVATGAGVKTATFGSTNGASVTAIKSGSAGISAVTSTNGPIDIHSGTGDITISDDAAATNVKLGTGGAAKTVTVGSTNTTSATVINAGSGGIHTVSAGLVNIDTAVDSQASPSATSVLNVNAGAATFTGFTTASAGTQDFTITNSLVTTSSNLLVTVCNEGANDAQMQVMRITRAAGSFVVKTKNQGAAALNGNVIVTFWLLDN